MIYLDKFGDELYKLRSIGYHNSEIHGDPRFFRSKDYWALHFVQSGKGTLILRGERYEISAGMFFLTPPHEPVNYYSDAKEPWKYFFISAFPDSILDVSSVFEFSGNNFTAIAKQPDKVLSIFEDFYKSNPSDTYFSALNVLNRILSSQFSVAEKRAKKQQIPQLVKNIKEIILFNYKNPEFSVADIADMLHIHPSRLSRIFKQETGETPISHLVNLRLDHAAQLLKNHNYTVNELCDNCGFCDERYFMKRFKRKFGITIREYYKTHSAETEP